jgi:uracil-DNA glycosylase
MAMRVWGKGSAGQTLPHRLRQTVGDASTGTGSPSLQTVSGDYLPVRGEVLTAQGFRIFVTIHPSYLLRLKNDKDEAREYAHFVADLRVCVAALGG